MKKILVVDNDLLILEFIRDLLIKKGYEVLTAENGLAALDILRTYTPEVIFVDLIMPEIDGGKLCRIIRKMKPLKAVFLVILSAIAAERKIDPETYGANLCIAKGPIHEMADLISQVLETYETDPTSDWSGETISAGTIFPRLITQELLMMKRHFELILETMSEGILEITSGGRVLYANPVAMSLTGLPEETLVGSEFLALFTGEDRNRVKACLDSLDGKSKTAMIDAPVQLNEYLVTVTINPVLDGGVSFIAILNDVTEYKRAENALRSEWEQLLSIFNSINQIIYITDPDTHEILYVNKALQEAFNKDPVGGICYREFQGFDSPCDFCTNDIILKKKYEPYQWEYHNPILNKDFMIIDRVIKWPDGRDVRFELAIDITQQKKMENQLQQIHKMEAIGTLAGGIAHDFNNILGVILGNAELAMEDVPDWNPGQHNLTEIRKACLRAKDVVRQILSFSRQTDYQRIPVEIGSIIKESLALLRSSIPTTIDIHHEISAATDVVLADATQIHQVLINLCTNAAYAMRDRGGILTISLENVTFDDNAVTHHPGLNSGRYVQLIISDTGQGISPEDMDKIFDPYFTTKQVGEGSGMGLAVAQGIIANHGGTITVSSEPGKGSNFCVLLPVTEEKPHIEEKTSESLPTGDERILFIDDEPDLADIVKQMLEHLGYHVTPSNSGIDAIDRFKAAPHNYDLVITDMTMPQMTGDVLAGKILKMRPNIPIIICTGYSERIDERTARTLGIRHYMEKPIDMQKLAVTVRNALDEIKPAR
jgi:PAS domain S-box-containing protein